MLRWSDDDGDWTDVAIFKKKKNNLERKNTNSGEFRIAKELSGDGTDGTLMKQKIKPKLNQRCFVFGEKKTHKLEIKHGQ